jgi:hypothetical protein
VTDVDLAEAVVDGLAGVERCAVCGEKCLQFYCREQKVAFCSGCVIKFRRRNDKWNTGQAARVLRYLVFRGWLQQFFDSPGKFDTVHLYEQMMVDTRFRSRWRN